MPSLTRLPHIADLFSEGVATHVTEPVGDWQQLWPEEQQLVAGAVDKRRAEFAAGRLAARGAMRELGMPDQPIGTDAQRTPRWPHGVTGSISHSEQLCVVVAGRSGDFLALGVDTEPDTPLERELWSTIARPNEIAWLQQLPTDRQGGAAKLLFCVKESIFKAIFPLARTFVEFDDVEVVMDDRAGNYCARLLRDFPHWPAGGQLTGRFAARQGNIIAGTEVRR